MEDQVQSSRKRVRDAGSDELELELAEVKRLRDDLLELLDDSDPDPVGQDLDSLMKSFQEELSAPPSPSPVTVVDLTSDSGESPSELGYLLEASDDDLGLPPSGSASSDEVEVTELVRVPSGIGEFWGFDSFYDQIPSFDVPFEEGTSEYIAFDDGHFGYSGGCFDDSGYSDIAWRSE